MLESLSVTFHRGNVLCVGIQAREILKYEFVDMHGADDVGGILNYTSSRICFFQL